ncbi:uncharacterized protein [Pyrus communis]|uniref:uncharacterized protein n=1 Tax=Pyrus communis TaxID=23211 RepID=UPI0035C22A12
MFSSRRVYKQFEEQQKRQLAQQEELVNLEEGGGGDEAFAMEEDEDDDHKRQMASHSRRVMEAVGQIAKPRRAANFNRKRERRVKDLLEDYFIPNSVFHNHVFRCRFRMQRSLFEKIMSAACNHDPYFVRKDYVFHVLGLLPEQKITAALRMLAYGASADQVDEIARMGKTIVLESLMRFCFAIKALYTNEYFQKPMPMDMRRLLRKAARMFDVEALRSIMMMCIILHNMIVEDEYDYDVVDEYESDTMNNSRTRIYCAHDATEDPVQHKPLERDGCYNDR